MIISTDDILKSSMTSKTSKKEKEQFDVNNISSILDFITTNLTSGKIRRFYNELKYIAISYPELINNSSIACILMHRYNSIGYEIINKKYGKDNAIEVTDIMESLIDMPSDMSINNCIIKLIEEYNGDPNGKDELIFAKACKSGKYKVVKLLVERYNVNVNSRDNFSLILACRFGHLNIAKFLIENGADYKARNGLAIKLLKNININCKKGDEKLWLKRFLDSLVEEEKV